MDCNMPIMDGFDSTIAIRKLTFIDQNDLKILALTANTNEFFKVKCKESGMNAFLSKPISVSQIREVL